MKIVEIELKDFQCHRHFKSKLGSGVNAIVGPGDIGKSAILRGVKWCLLNQPDGTGFIRKWYNEGGGEQTADKASVKIVFDTGASIERIRGKKINRYVIHQPGEEDLILNRFGKGIPDEVKAVTGIDLVQIGDKEICVQIQDQHDPYFLLSGVSGPSRWRSLSAVAGTLSADQAMANLESQIRQVGKDIKSTDAELAKLNDELKEDLSELESVSSTREALDVITNEVEPKAKKRDQLEKLIAAGIDLKAKTKEALARKRVLSGFVQDVQEIEEAIEKSASRATSIGSLVQRLEKIRSSQEKIEKASSAFDSVSSVELPNDKINRAARLRSLLRRGASLSKEKKRLDSQKKALSTISSIELPEVSRYEALSNLAQEVASWRKKKEDARSSLAKAEKALLEAREELQQELQSAGQCPTCGRKIDRTTHSYSS